MECNKDLCVHEVSYLMPQNLNSWQCHKLIILSVHERQEANNVNSKNINVFTIPAVYNCISYQFLYL
jgi:hypothetical protein